MRNKSVARSMLHCVVLLTVLLFAGKANAQCLLLTPHSTLDMRGKPDSTWTSSTINLTGLVCCSLLENCVRFTVTLDNDAQGIILTNVNGPGYYRMSCGTAIPTGDTMCLAGGGTYSITFCRGILGVVTTLLNGQVFTITSIPKSHVSLRDTTICENKNYAFVPRVTGGTWTGQGGVFTVENATTNRYVPSQTEINNGSTSLVVSVTTNCTTVRDTMRVTIKKAPKPVINGTLAPCAYTSGNVYRVSPVTAGSSYSWQVSGGSISSLPGKDSVLVTWGTSGSGSLRVVETNAAGCQGADSIITISIMPKPGANITGPTIACKNLLTGYTATATAGHSYQWSISGGTLVSGQGTAAVQVYWNNTGAQSLQLKQRNTASGCDSTFTRSVTVFDKPAAAITGTDSACRQSTHTYSTAVVPRARYLWSVNTATILSSATSNSVQIQWSTVGTQRISLVVTDTTTGCDSLITMDVWVKDLPAADISGSLLACQGDTSSIYTATGCSICSHAWNVTVGSIVYGQLTKEAKVMWASPGSSTLRVVATEPVIGCQAEKSINVLVRPKPVTGLITH